MAKDGKSAALAVIGEAIFTSRMKAGRTVVDVADEAGMSRQTLWLIERGEQEPRVMAFARLCDVLKIDPGALLQRVSGMRALAAGRKTT